MTRYLTVKEVILINALMITRYTPKEQKGVKDIGLLESALARPQQTVFGKDAYTTIWEKAGALFSSVTQNHAFYNANKRTGFASMKQFLWVNGYNFTVDEREAVEYTVIVVKEKPIIKTVSEWIESNSVRRK